MKASTAKLTATEAERALYVDYEGNVDRPPTLLGWREDGRTDGAIIEPNFSTCEDRWRARGVFVWDHEELVKDLITRAEQEDRHIVSWSEHDWRHMMRILRDEAWQERLCKVYRNAIQTARPWYRRNHGPLPQAATLNFFLTLFGEEPPEIFGLEVVGTALRLLRTQLAEQRSYPELTPTARKAWVRVVKHNRLDLAGMEFVMKRVTERE